MPADNFSRTPKLFPGICRWSNGSAFLQEGNATLSTTGITSSLLSQITSTPSTANQLVTDLNLLSQDLQGGNLSAAQEDYVTLSQDALNGVTSAAAGSSASGITVNLLSDISSSSTSSSAFVSELNQLGSDLQTGNLGSAQSDMLSLDSTALNAASGAGPSNGSNGASSAVTSSAAVSSSADSKQLIQAIVQGMAAGDNSDVSSAMSELASISTSSAGVRILEQQSQNYGASAGSTSPSSTASTSASSISQLMQSLENGSAATSSPALSLLA